MIRILVLIFCLVTSNVYAGIVIMPQYGTGDSVTADNQNLRFNRLTNTVSGGLDNNNADTDSGFRFIEILSSLPAAGNQGRVVFDTSVNTLFFDTGAVFLAVGVLANDQTWTGSNIFNGTTTIDDAVITTVDINGGTIDGTTIGAASGVTGKFTTVTQNSAHFTETTAPSTAAGEMGCYTKDTGGQPEFFCREESNGDEVQITELGRVRSGLKLISVTSGTGSNTGDIAIEASKQYHVTAELKAPTSAGQDVNIRFNSSTTSTGYSWSISELDHGTSPTFAVFGDDSHDEIVIIGSGLDQTTGVLKCRFDIDTYKFSTTLSATITGQCLHRNSTIFTVQFGGAVTQDLTITSFEIFPTTGNFTFDVKVYELIQS